MLIPSMWPTSSSSTTGPDGTAVVPRRTSNELMSDVAAVAVSSTDGRPSCNAVREAGPVATITTST